MVLELVVTLAGLGRRASIVETVREIVMSHVRRWHMSRHLSLPYASQAYRTGARTPRVRHAQPIPNANMPLDIVSAALAIVTSGTSASRRRRRLRRPCQCVREVSMTCARTQKAHLAHRIPNAIRQAATACARQVGVPTSTRIGVGLPAMPTWSSPAPIPKALLAHPEHIATRRRRCVSATTTTDAGVDRHWIRRSDFGGRLGKK